MLVLVSAWNFQHHPICSILGVASQLEQCLLPPLITCPVYFPLSRFQCRAVASTTVQVRCVSHVHGQWVSNRKRWPLHDYRYKWNCKERFSAAFTSYLLQATYSLAVNALLQFQRPYHNRNGNRKREKQEDGENFMIFPEYQMWLEGWGWVGDVAGVESLVEKPEGRMWHVIPNRKWKACIKIDAK